MKIGHLLILNAVQDIKDIQGQEKWKEIVHTILRIGIIRALNESAGGPFNSTQLNSNLFANHITFNNGYMKCAHKRQRKTNL